MGYRGNITRMPLNQSGFQHPRNTDLIVSPALIEPTRNVNMHEGAIGKRGGTSHYIAGLTNLPIVRGLHQFLKPASQFILFHTSLGRLYHTDESHELATGLSGSFFPCMVDFDNKVFFCDGATNPKYWDGTTLTAANVTPASSWTGNMPFQFIPHSFAASHRLWALTADSAWASKLNDGTDFSDAQVQQIRIYSKGGLVGGYDFGGTLFAWDRTQGYIIDDTDPNPDNWGYHEVLWEGGLAHWRLICKAGNELYLMTEDGLIYSIRGVQATGDYESSQLTRPANIDRWIKEKVSLSSIEKFHAKYDRKLRAIKWFMQVGGSNPNTALTYFIDKDPSIAWVPHNNASSLSGYDAASSAEVRVGVGDYQVWTGDWAGNIWKLEQSTRHDSGVAYSSGPKFKRIDFDKPRNWKHFRSCRLRSTAQGNFHLTIRIWIDGVRHADVPVVVTGQGAAFDVARFDEGVFSAEDLIPTDFDIGAYGYDIQLEILNEEAGEDFFHAEIEFNWKDCGVRL